MIPANVEVAVVEAAVALINDENVEVPRSPRIVVVDVLPTNIPSREVNDVEEADLKSWRPVQIFACVRSNETLTSPVAGEMLRVPSEFETEVTTPEAPESEPH